MSVMVREEGKRLSNHICTFAGVTLMDEESSSRKSLSTEYGEIEEKAFRYLHNIRAIVDGWIKASARYSQERDTANNKPRYDASFDPFQPRPPRLGLGATATDTPTRQLDSVMGGQRLRQIMQGADDERKKISFTKATSAKKRQRGQQEPQVESRSQSIGKGSSDKRKK